MPRILLDRLAWFLQVYIHSEGDRVARRVDVHEPNQLTWALGEERLRVLLPLGTTERTIFVEIDAARASLGSRVHIVTAYLGAAGQIRRSPPYYPALAVGRRGHGSCRRRSRR